MGTTGLRPPDFEAARRHCEAAWPAEGVCAYLASRDGWVFVPLPNVADEVHARDPRAFPSTAKTSFVVDPRAWMALEVSALDAAQAGHDPAVWLIHSHVDASAGLSAWDRSTFTVDGRPLLPGLALAVFSVRDGRAEAPPARWRFAPEGWAPTL